MHYSLHAVLIFVDHETGNATKISLPYQEDQPTYLEYSEQGAEEIISSTVVSAETGTPVYIDDGRESESDQGPSNRRTERSHDHILKRIPHTQIGHPLNSRICNHPVCKRSTRKGLARSSSPLEFDFNFVFNCVVVVSNAIVLLGAAVMNCSLCSCSGWLSAFILVNVLCPGVVVIIDTLPAELGTYLLMVICESMLWLGVAVWRLRDSFQKQSEFILALLLYSLCTSYVAWSGPALYVEVRPRQCRRADRAEFEDVYFRRSLALDHQTLHRGIH